MMSQSQLGSLFSIFVISVIFFAIGCDQVLDQIKRDLSGDTDVPSPDDKVPAPDSISKDDVVSV